MSRKGVATAMSLALLVTLAWMSPPPVAGDTRTAVGGAAPAEGLSRGAPAPDFLLPRIEGPPVRLADLRGRRVVLAFWAFWCDTWKEVHRGFTHLSRDHEELGFELVTVNIDCQWNQQLLPLLERREVPYQALMDPRSEVSSRWKVRVVPTICLIDERGVLRDRFEGYPGNGRLLEHLRALARR